MNAFSFALAWNVFLLGGVIYLIQVKQWHVAWLILAVLLLQKPKIKY
jgi:hypothetical protein